MQRCLSISPHLTQRFTATAWWHDRCSFPSWYPSPGHHARLRAAGPCRGAHCPPRGLLVCVQADAATLAGIRRQYGDFLYSKRDYDQAMEQ